MKRKLISILMVLLLCLPLVTSVSALEIAFLEDGNSVYDEADLLSSSEEERIAGVLEDLSREYAAQIVIVTVSELDSDPDIFVENLYDTMGFGYGDDHDGILLLVCMDPREYRILPNGAANNAIGSREIDAIGNAIVSDLSDGDYTDAFVEFADQCAYYLDGHINGFPFNFGRTLITALGIGILAGVIVAFVLKGQLKSVRSRYHANDYVKPGSMQLTVHSDLFLYRNITKTRKANNQNSSGSGGSSRSVGGGSF